MSVYHRWGLCALEERKISSCLVSSPGPYTLWCSRCTESELQCNVRSERGLRLEADVPSVHWVEEATQARVMAAPSRKLSLVYTSQGIVKALTILVFAYHHHWYTLIMYY